MGDNWQTVIFRDVPEERASDDGAKLLGFLQAECILAANTSNCVFGGDGYAPGTKAKLAVEEGRWSEFTLRLRTNGAEFGCYPQVHYSPASFDDVACACPNCKAVHGGDFLKAVYIEALQPWTDNGQFSIRCPSCSALGEMADWDIGDSRQSPIFAVGCLSLKFWNWDRLSRPFFQRLGESVQSRVLFISGRV